MFKKAWNVITKVFISLMIVLAVLLAGVRLAGLLPYTVASGSMSPAYRVGSLIYVKPVAPENVQVGDPITFTLKDDHIVATHRVIKIDTGKEHFYTKGDANELADGSPVHFSHLIGKPVFCIPLLGYFSSYVSHPPGLYIAVIVGIALVLLAFIPDIFKKEQQDSQIDKDAKTQKPDWCKATDRTTQ